MPARKKLIKKTIKKKPGQARIVVQGTLKGERISSRELEEHLQATIEGGARSLLVKANGQHGIGGRIWPRSEKVKLIVEGPVGQRLGSMGMMGTEIRVKGSASDDVGWINCGAVITVLGDVTNGAHNAAAQGKLYVQGGGGARCDTMTKSNPRFDPPESWYFRDVGDSFAEFKAGGIAVVCGVNPRAPENILGYRPCVGMVGGMIYFHGPITGYSDSDVKLMELSDDDFAWLKKSMKPFLKAVQRTSHYDELTKDINDWRKLMAHTPSERAARRKLPLSMTEFREQSWEMGVGGGGIFSPYLSHDQSVLPYITTSEHRRNKPLWRNDKYLPPCAYNCPTRIPSHQRATLIRQGMMKEALNLVLQYSPLPATVCGEICPNLCMQSCTRGQIDKPLNIKEYGRLALELKAPKPASPTGYKVGIIGGGPAGLSAAWQLGLKGHEVHLYEAEGKLGGKIEICIPRERMPQEILLKEISRFREIGVNVHLGAKIDAKGFKKIYKDNDIVVVAIGAHQPRVIKFKGSKDVVPAIEFLKGINFGDLPELKGKKVVIIGAGNVGMDVAVQAAGCGAKDITAIDVQKPAAFGKELEMAMDVGTKISWPKFTDRYDKKNKKLYFTDGSSMDADIVIMSVGEVPILNLLPTSIITQKGWLIVDDKYKTSDSKVFAIGDATKPGLVTHAIGHGRIAADVIHSELMHFDYMAEVKEPIPYGRIRNEYYEAGRGDIFNASDDAHACMSCGWCRDCHMCEVVCYWGAIKRVELEENAFEYVVDEDKCIGCGFCAAVCPTGVWEMVENI